MVMMKLLDHHTMENFLAFWRSFLSLTPSWLNTLIKGRGSTSYLSSTIYEELIKQMGDKVKATIATGIQYAKYFSLIVDS